jgi:putative ABC transport system permease protein
MLGYAFPELTVLVPVRSALGQKGDSLARVDVDWSWDNGLTHVDQVPDFAWITSRRLRANYGARVYSDEGLWFVSSKGQSRDVCPANLDASRPDARPESRQSTMWCFSRTKGGDAGSGVLKGRLAVPVSFPLSYVVAAVDPASEEALVGLDGALTSGEGLSGASTRYPKSATGNGVPVLVSDQSGSQITARFTVSRMGQEAAESVLNGADQQDLLRMGEGGARRQTVMTAQDAHGLLLDQFRSARPDDGAAQITRNLPGELTLLGQVSLPSIDGSTTPARVELKKLGRPTAVDLARGVQFQVPGSNELSTRQVETSRKPGQANDTALPVADTLYLRGTYASDKLTGLDDLTAQVLAGYDAAPTEGADARSADLLGGVPLAPSGSLGGLVQPPPTMLTSLRAAKILTDEYTEGHGSAPLSAIRVRVAGVRGVDDLSRERVRLVAQRIQDETGLEVDITTGSSATKEILALPAGRYGRPALTLSQWWVKKGVALTILKQLDKKSLVLFFLVLLVSAVSVANSTIASVRSRRTDLGVLACLGWRPIHLFRIVLLELFLIASTAGLISAGLALVLSHLAGTPVSISRASLAIPAALVVAAIAGAVPAWLAARAEPMDAVRLVANPPRRAQRVASLGALARVGLRRVKARTLLASVGLALAVVVFTVLLAITLAFQGAVVGTVLGDAVAIQARGADYAATGATLILASLGVANVMYLNIRDRGAELATLRAVGWTEAHLVRLLITEGAWIGVLGATPGAIIGLLLATTVTDAFTFSLVLGAIVAWAAAVFLSIAAAGFAATVLRGLPTTILLTE